MIVVISSASALSVREADDFGSFKVLIEGTDLGRGDIEGALAAIGQLDADGTHAWIDPDLLLAREATGREAHWTDQFRAMIETARKYGFGHPETSAIRAHLEWAER